MTEEQVKYLKKLSSQHELVRKNQERITHSKSHLDYMINEAMERNISATRIAKAVNLSPARIHQIRKEFISGDGSD